MNVIGSRYIYIYTLLLPCTAVDLYSDVVECLPVHTGECNWWYLRVLPVLHRPEVVDIGVNTM